MLIYACTIIRQLLRDIDMHICCEDCTLITFHRRETVICYINFHYRYLISGRGNSYRVEGDAGLVQWRIEFGLSHHLNEVRSLPFSSQRCGFNSTSMIKSVNEAF